MSSLHFTDTVTHVPAHWANDVDSLVYDIFDGAQTKLQARMAMGFGTLVYQNANQVQIAGGTIDNTVIGFAHPAAAKFTDAIIEHAPYQQYHVTNKKYVDGKFDMLVDMINVASGNRYVAMVVDGTPVPAISGSDAFSFVAGANIVLTPQVGTRTMTIAASIPPPSNDYSILDVDGTPVPALSVGDTFSLVAGTNITLTPNVGGRSVTIDASGGGGGNVVTNSQLVNASGAWSAEWADSEEVTASNLWTGNTSLIFGRDNGGNPEVSPLRDTGGIIELQWGTYDATHTVRSPLGTILGSSSCYIGDGTGSVLSQEYNMVLSSSQSGVSRNCTYCSIVNGDTVSLLNANGTMKGHVFVASARLSDIANLDRGFFGSISNVLVGTTTMDSESIFIGCSVGSNIGNTGSSGCTDIALVVGNSNTITDSANVGILLGGYNTIATSNGVSILAGDSNTVTGNNMSAIVAGWDNTFGIQRSVLVNAQWSDFGIDPTNPDIVRTTVLMGTHNRQRVSNSIQVGSGFAEGIAASNQPFLTAQNISFVAGAVTDGGTYTAVLNSQGPSFIGAQDGVYCFPEENGTAGFEVLVTASDLGGDYYETWKITGILYKHDSVQYCVSYIEAVGSNPRGDWSISVLDPMLAPFFGLHVEVSTAAADRTIWTAYFSIIENVCTPVLEA